MNDGSVADEEFLFLLQQASGGSPSAMREVIERYAPHIVRAVRRKLNRAIRAKFDSFDFVQAVWASFFADLPRLVDFDRPEDLMRHLVAVAHNKVVDETRRRLTTEKYNINRERSLEDSTVGLGRRLAAKQPSPSEVAIGKEVWSRLAESQPEHYRRILELRRDGYTQREIAEQTGVTERTVRRVIRSAFERQA